MASRKYKLELPIISVEIALPESADIDLDIEAIKIKELVVTEAVLVPLEEPQAGQ